ncbi:MAG: efflux RND transporter periplasmic adaptor subunit, partial [Pseudomonadota bacterium]
MKLKLNKKQLIAIALVLAVGVVLAGLILGTAKSRPEGEAHGGHAEAASHADAEHHGSEAKDGHADDEAHTDAEHHGAEAGPRKGPHGGKLFSQDGYGVELTIYETGVEPQFRAYTYQNGKPLDPRASEVSVTLDRLGRKPQVFAFAPEKDYLKGDAVVEEPHSFKVTIDARYDNKAYRFDYEQVEARVAMSDEQLRQNQVEVLTAGPVRIRNVLQLIGEVRFNEDRTVHVVPRLSGIVQSVAANAGDRVKKGQVLAVVSSQARADQRAELLATQKRLALARTIFEREKKLW